jgi:hypothetical protein
MVSVQNKRLIAGIVLLVSFLYAVFAVSSMVGVGVHNEECALQAVCPHEQRLNLLVSGLPLLASLAVLAGAGTYYVMSEKIETSKRTAIKTGELVLKFLDAKERKVVDLLIRNKGKMFQAEVSRLEGMGKLKAHRIIQRLVERGVIEVQKSGKTNILRFPKDIEESLVGTGE